jgi:hypothetical protein
MFTLMPIIKEDYNKAGAVENKDGTELMPMAMMRSESRTNRVNKIKVLMLFPRPPPAPALLPPWYSLRKR